MNRGKTRRMKPLLFQTELMSCKGQCPFSNFLFRAMPMHYRVDKNSYLTHSRVCVAGLNGFEPSNTGVKVPALTAWGQPKKFYHKQINMQFISSSRITNADACFSPRSSLLLAEKNSNCVINTSKNIVMIFNASNTLFPPMYFKSKPHIS